MAIPQEQLPLWSGEITLGTGDTTKTVQAAPATPYAGRTLFVTHLVARVLVAAAQDVDIKIGTTLIRRIKASEVVGTETFVGPMLRGLRGQPATALTITPAAAGPSVHVVAEGYYGD